MRLVTPFERVLIALGPSRNIALLELDEPISSAAAVAQVMAWVDAWPRFGMVFHEFGPWYRADQASVDPVRHVIAVDAGDTPVETLLTATLTGTLDPDIPPWQVVLVNPADGDGDGPCRIIAHFDHLIADGVRFVNLLAASRTHDRQPAAFAAAAKRLRRLSLRRVPGRAARSARHRAGRGAFSPPRSTATRPTMTRAPPDRPGGSPGRSPARLRRSPTVVASITAAPPSP